MSRAECCVLSKFINMKMLSYPLISAPDHGFLHISDRSLPVVLFYTSSMFWVGFLPS